VTLSRLILLIKGSVLKKVVEKLKHILCSITFSENCAFYELMCKNMVEPERPQIAI
jgi:hypothetical protein